MREKQSVAARAVYQMIPFSASSAVPLPCSCGEKPVFPTTIIETAMTKEKADALHMLNGMIEIPIAGSGSVVRNRMLCGVNNPAPEAYKHFNPGGQGLAYEVSLACGNAILPFGTSK